MIEADDFEAFGEAILAKLLQEIAAAERRPRSDRMAVLPGTLPVPQAWASVGNGLPLGR